MAKTTEKWTLELRFLQFLYTKTQRGPLPDSPDLDCRRSTDFYRSIEIVIGILCVCDLINSNLTHRLRLFSCQTFCIQHAPSTWTTFSLCCKMWSQKALSCKLFEWPCKTWDPYLLLFHQVFVPILSRADLLSCWEPKIWNIITSYPAQLLWGWPWDMLCTVHQATQGSGPICSGQLKKEEVLFISGHSSPWPLPHNFRTLQLKCPGLRLCVKICKSTFWRRSRQIFTNA